MRKIYGECALRTAIGIIMVGLLLAGSAGALTLTVCPSGCAFSSIQAAVNASSIGDTIQVQSGTYYENVNVTKQLTLRSIGMPVVDARGSGSAITLSADGIRLEGFTSRGSSYPEAGINVTSNSNMLRGNNASNNVIGIFLSASSNNTLNGNNASNNEQSGIGLSSSSNNSLSGNNASNNDRRGIYLDYSSNNTLNSNIMTGNTHNFHVNGNSDSDFNNQIDTSNLVDGRPAYYIIKASDMIYDSSINIGTLYCISCVNITIKDMNLNNNGDGIFFWNTTNSRIQNVNASTNIYGIGLLYSSNNTLIGNNASNNEQSGIGLSFSSNNTLRGNNASSNYAAGISLGYSSNNNTLSSNNASNNDDGGISLQDSSNNNTLSGNNASSNNGMGIGLSFSSNNNTLSGNNASNNDYGIWLSDSSNNNTLNGNNASNNNMYGIYLSGSLSSSNNNNIYNNFFNNINNIYGDPSSSNIWNITRTSGINIIEGSYIGGNVWAYPNGTGFSQTCEDVDNDGICDSPYTLDSNNTDYLPLAYKPPNILKGDLNNNGVSADAGDLVLMKRASIGEIPADSRYDLNNNGQNADAGDLVLMKRASIGEINL